MWGVGDGDVGGLALRVFRMVGVGVWGRCGKGSEHGLRTWEGVMMWWVSYGVFVMWLYFNNREEF